MGEIAVRWRDQAAEIHRLAGVAVLNAVAGAHKAAEIVRCRPGLAGRPSAGSSNLDVAEAGEIDDHRPWNQRCGARIVVRLAMTTIAAVTVRDLGTSVLAHDDAVQLAVDPPAP